MLGPAGGGVGGKIALTRKIDSSLIFRGHILKIWSGFAGCFWGLVDQGVHS
jgi:hypothetical protein